MRAAVRWSRNNDAMVGDFPSVRAGACDYLQGLYAIHLETQLAERDASFELYWSASMRGIKMWQEATGEDMVWPDQAHLIVWLLEKLTQVEEELVEANEEISALVQALPLEM